MAVAQVPELYDSFPFRAREYFYMNIGWSLVSLIIVVIGSLLALILVYKKSKYTRILILAGLLVFCVWYFYPSFTHKGIYTATVDGRTETIVIDEVIRGNEGSSHINISYNVKPFQRMLWTNFANPSPHYEHLPISLGWNKFYLPTWYNGIVEYKKVKTGEPEP